MTITFSRNDLFSSRGVIACTSLQRKKGFSKIFLEIKQLFQLYILHRLEYFLRSKLNYETWWNFEYRGGNKVLRGELFELVEKGKYCLRIQITFTSCNLICSDELYDWRELSLYVAAVGCCRHHNAETSAVVKIIKISCVISFMIVCNSFISLLSVTDSRVGFRSCSEVLGKLFQRNLQCFILNITHLSWSRSPIHYSWIVFTFSLKTIFRCFIHWTHQPLLIIIVMIIWSKAWLMYHWQWRLVTVMCHWCGHYWSQVGAGVDTGAQLILLIRGWRTRLSTSYDKDDILQNQIIDRTSFLTIIIIQIINNNFSFLQSFIWKLKVFTYSPLYYFLLGCWLYDEVVIYNQYHAVCVMLLQY